MELSQFTNQYSLSKTLRFKLIPTEATKSNLERDMILATDQKRADEYIVVKKLLDRYHKEYIERKLSTYSFPHITLDHYYECYRKNRADDLEEAQKAMMQQVSEHLRCFANKKPGEEYNKLFSKQMVKTILPEYLTDEKEKETVRLFSEFWTYLSGYCQNRENMYTGEGKATEIAYRIVKQNLPKFLDNLRVWEKIKEEKELPESDIKAVDEVMEGLIGMTSETVFTVHSFNNFLTQSGIEKYNKYIGGYTNEDGSKVQGINEKINLYSQRVKERLPKFKPLFKQILSDRDSISFIPEMFSSDNQMLQTVSEFHNYVSDALESLHSLLQEISAYNTDHIFVANDASLTTVSNYIYGSWSTVKIGLERRYEQQNPITAGRSAEKYEEAKEKHFKSLKSLSLSRIIDAAHAAVTEENLPDLKDSLMKKEAELFNVIGAAYQTVQRLLESDYPANRSFAKDDDNIKLLKDYLDSIKEYQRFVGLLSGVGNEPDKDSVFYGVFEEQFDILSGINRLYDMVRNYVTRKPFKTDKIRLTFNRPKLLDGWVDSHTEQSDNGTQYGGYLFRKKNLIGEYDYYLGISPNVRLFRAFTEVPSDDISEYERLDYYQPKAQSIYGASYMGDSYEKDKRECLDAMIRFARSQNDHKVFEEISKYCANEKSTPSGCYSLYEKKYPHLISSLCHNKKFVDSNRNIINNLQETMRSISHRLPEAMEIAEKNYDLFKEIIADIDTLSKNKGYSYFYVSRSEMEKALCNPDKPLYLFMIHNKDLGYAEAYTNGNRKSRGTENLHTMYFKQLMSGDQSVLDIGSGAVFYRAASLPHTPTHPHDQEIKKRRNPSEHSIFSYDLYKDKRYTEDTYLFHLSITLNYKSDAKTPKIVQKINKDVLRSIKQSQNQYVIGIDRGERNLLYVSVIDSHARIVEQLSLNVIEDSYGDSVKRTDYHDLLDRKEKDRLESRKEWKTIEGIKELKEGYLSQAVHRICLLIEKYGAIIVMENLNSGFKNTRSAVEKSVYQKFEKMLCDKLSFMVDKQKQPTECGGILNAYQLAEPTTSYNNMRGQNGIIFYVPAWLTSKIDPTTGFADMLRPRYESVERAKEFFDKFDSITYCAEDKMFRFAVDLSAFPKTEANYQKKWVICTNGDRIRTFRSETQNNQWVSKSVCLTDEMIELFQDYGIDHKSGDLRPAILRQTEKAFFTRLIGLLKLTLQMRNSITGTDVDYMISPVRNSSGTFYDSRHSDGTLPVDADANGAYNIARKGLWIVEQLKKSEDVTKVTLSMTGAQWLEYAQTHFAGEKTE